MTEVAHKPSVCKDEGTECYHIRVPEEMTWGYIFLHPNFVIACYTDYGNYAYGWHSGNTPTMEAFKRELLRFKPVRDEQVRP